MKLVYRLFKQLNTIPGKINKINWYELKNDYNKLTTFKKAGAIAPAILAVWLIFGIFKSSTQQKITTKIDLARVLYIESCAEEREKYIKLYSVAQAEQKVKIFAPGKGRIFELQVAKGDFVKQNQELVKISPLDYAAILANATNQVRELEEIIGDEEVVSVNLASKLKHAQNRLDKAKNYSKNMIIRSPIEGRVEKIEINIGDEVEPKEELLLVVNPKKIFYKAYVTEHLINKINSQSPVAIKTAADREFSGQVTFVSRAANEKNLSYEVDVAFDNSAGAIAEGSSAELFIAAEKVRAHKVPQSALVINDDGDLGVMVYNAEEKKAYFVKAQMIDQDNDHIWIVGPEEKANIIFMGQGFLKSGSEVIAKLIK